MYADELQAVLATNTFDLVAAVAETALADALEGEETAQEWLDCVAPDWRERHQPPAQTWTPVVSVVPVVATATPPTAPAVAPATAPPKLCECGQPFTGHGNRSSGRPAAQAVIAYRIAGT